MADFIWILILALCILNEVIPVTASYCYYSSFYSYYYCDSSYSFPAGAIPGIVFGCIIFGVIVFIVVMVVCKQMKTSGNRGTVVHPTTRITTVQAPPPVPSFSNQPAGMSYPPPPGQNMAYPPPPQGQFGYPQPPPPQGLFGYAQPPPPPAYGGYGAPPPPY